MTQYQIRRYTSWESNYTYYEVYRMSILGWTRVKGLHDSPEQAKEYIRKLVEDEKYSETFSV